MRQANGACKQWRGGSCAAVLLALACAAGSHAVEAGGPTPAFLGPVDVAIAPRGDHLYVACADARQVLSVTLPEGVVKRRLDVPAEPTGLALSRDGRHLFVTCAAPRSQVLEIDTRTGRVLRTFPTGHSSLAPVLDEASDRLYVCNRFSNNVSVIRLSDGTELTRVAVPREPVGAALVPDERRLLVANHLPHRSADPALEYNVNAVVTVIDTTTLESNDLELYSGASSMRGICVSPDGEYAFVTHVLSNFENVPFRVDMGWINVNVVSVIDLTRMKTITAIGLDELQEGAANPWGIRCSAGGQDVWVASAGTHQLCRIAISDLVGDTARKTMSPLPGAWPVYPSLGESLWQRVPLPGKGPRNVATHGTTAYVAEYFSDTVSIVSCDAQQGTTVRSLALGPTPKLTLQRRGQMLFDDATICYQQWQSCASCHPDGRADALNWDLMNDGVGNPKNSKSMVLSHQTPPSMAKGVRETAEVAVRSGLSHILFAFRPDDEAAAIDAYLKSLKPVPSPYLEDGKLSDAAERGKVLFHSRRIGCSRCHPPPLYTDMRLHRMGRTPSRYFPNRFDTPTLLEVWRTGPYLHDGQFATVKELLEARHGLPPDAELTDDELDELAEFVLSL